MKNSNILITARVLAAVLSGMLSCGPTLADEAPKHFTGDTISMDPKSPTYFGNFAPELASSVARKPVLDPKTGLSVNEVKPGLFFVTDGIYQAAFLATDQGIVVFDAPQTFADRLPAAIAKAVPGKAISHLILSHDHRDHVGGSGVFANIPGLEVITSEKVAASLVSEAYEGALLPTKTFAKELDLTVGGIEIQLDAASYHSEDEDVIAYLPSLKFLVAIDTITPGEVPFMGFGATADFGRFTSVFDTLLAYDFDTIMSGHISVLGTRQDVIDNRDYTYDVRDTVLEEMKTMFPKFEKTYADTNYANGNIAYRMTIEQMRNACAAQIIGRWSSRMSVVDVYADSHCQTAILYYIMH